MRRWLWALLPLAVAGGLIAFLALGFGHDPRYIPSPLIDKPAPKFALQTLADPARSLSSADLHGQVALVNVFASWCVACTDESASLAWLAGQGVRIYGLDYSDTRPAAKAWLARWGNPYRAVAFDPRGTAALDWGIYGVPETFALDRNGRIRHKFTGVITLEAAKSEVLPLLRKLESGS
ncbi:MAG TPA: DsbE family thiol:disulfide interchange protein [Gammaproteobacteria bacterium]|nr:DsbE family thiol:disulfide interchange protein [Gammaproteobacteria bacterium]